ncbi:MAG: hypothetical protein K9L22_01080 [Methylococcaceae bacterium]|nr:hypothetical protein [Methylococcaceae bacterium]
MSYKLLFIVMSFFVSVHLSVADTRSSASSSSSTNGTDQAAVSKYIKGSYLLIFKEPASGEQAFVKAHSKEEIAQLLQTNGQIVAVFEAINTIHMLIDAEEAARLRLDPRVLMVEQDGITTLATMPTVQGSNASQFPRYKDGILTIPRVDTDIHPGHYQDARLSFTGQGTQGTWTLLDYKTLGENVPLVYLESVDMVKTDIVPVQVFLVAKGQLPNECFDIGQINQRLDGNHFTVIATVVFAAPQGSFCTQALASFEKVMPLDVYGLKAGTYSYEIKGSIGNITGVFELEEDNILPTTTNTAQ